MHMEHENRRCSCHGNDIFLEQGTIPAKLCNTVISNSSFWYKGTLPRSSWEARICLSTIKILAQKQRLLRLQSEVTHIPLRYRQYKHFPNKVGITRHINKNNLIKLRRSFHLKSLLKSHKIFTDSSFNIIYLLHLPFLSLRSYLKVYQGLPHWFSSQFLHGCDSFISGPFNPVITAYKKIDLQIYVFLIHTMSKDFICTNVSRPKNTFFFIRTIFVCEDKLQSK